MRCGIDHAGITFLFFLIRIGAFLFYLYIKSVTALGAMYGVLTRFSRESQHSLAGGAFLEYVSFTVADLVTKKFEFPKHLILYPNKSSVFGTSLVDVT